MYTRRPLIHFTPPKGWMNDPNGLFIFEDKYHLFYQAIPDKMTHQAGLGWGHAVSKDLFHWNNLDAAILPDSKGDIWSGSVVIDQWDSSNIKCDEVYPLFAFYTRGNQSGQDQALAYSCDQGFSWKKYKHNPVLRNPGIKDFRDPKVFRDSDSNLWIMVLSGGNKILFYTSANLLDWTYRSEFTTESLADDSVWECPDLFELTIEGTQEKCWVLIISQISNAPNGGSGVRYFTGTFKNYAFVSSSRDEDEYWLDYGKDFYAATSFAAIPGDDERRIILAWMNNWEYANEIPTSPWKGMMTIPRKLSLVELSPQKKILRSEPVEELKELRNAPLSLSNIDITKTFNSHLPESDNTATETKIEYIATAGSEITICFSNQSGDELKIEMDHGEGRFTLNRSLTGKMPPKFTSGSEDNFSPFWGQSEVTDLQMIIDTFSIEIFINGGLISFTEQIFPEKPFQNINISLLKGHLTVKKLLIWKLTI